MVIRICVMITGIILSSSVGAVKYTKEGLVQLAHKTALNYKISPSLLKTVCHVESNWKPEAIGDDGRSIGLCQVQVHTALNEIGKEWYRGKSHSYRYSMMYKSLLNPAFNLDIAARLLQRYLHMFEGEEVLALIAYNAGEHHKILSHLRKINRIRKEYK